MEHVTQEEIDAFIREARAAFPHMSTHDAIFRLAMDEGREACRKLGLDFPEPAPRTTYTREFRDRI